jgi:hypothetical protein
MKKLLLALLCLLNICFAGSFAQNSKKQNKAIKLKASYQVEKQQDLELIVTQIPKKFPWIEKDLDGSTINPEENSIIIAQNSKALKIFDKAGNSYTIPKGSKFFARVTETIAAKRFWKKGKAKLDFFALAISDGKYDEFFEETSFLKYNGEDQIEPQISRNSTTLKDKLSFDSRNQEGMRDNLKNIGKLTAATLGGAIAGPFMLFSISSIAGATLVTNPYVLGSSMAVGGAVGLTQGILNKGEKFSVEPGKKITIHHEQAWTITKILSDDLKNKSTLTAEKINNNFSLDILKVKKKKDTFGDAKLEILLSYINKTKEKLSYMSFKLIDSTGKGYEANVDDLSTSFFEGLPKSGKLKISFSVDYPNTTHQLKVINSRQQTLAYQTLDLANYQR